MNEKLETIRKISNRLATALLVLVLAVIAGAFFAYFQPGSRLVNAPIAAFAAGVVGGFVGLQRRLKSMSDDDLTLLANSWVYVCLSPLVGGILAVVLYVLFISKLVSGELFPAFVPDPSEVRPVPRPVGESVSAFAAGASSASLPVHKGFAEIFAVHGASVDYAKMMFWSFVAGFSEKFVVDIVSRFESKSGQGPAAKPGA